MTVDLHLTTVIAAPVELAVDLSLDIDVHVGSMSVSAARAITAVTGGRIGLGER